MAFWLEKSAVSLAMLMHLAAIQGYDMSAVYAWANKLGQETVLNATRDLRVSRELAASCMEILTDSRSADSIRMTMNRSLGWVIIPQLKAMVTGPQAGPFDEAGFAESRGTLYMIMREGATSVAAPLFRALTDHVHRSTILAGSLTASRKLSPGVFFALDEVANIGVPALAQKLADSAGYGAFLTIVIHSLAQLRDAYGQDKAAAIWSCCGCKMILPGVDDADALERLSTLCGTITQDETKIPVISPESIRMLPDTRALIILVNRSPVTVKFRIPWHRISYRLGRLPKAPQLFVPAEIVIPEPQEAWHELDPRQYAAHLADLAAWMEAFLAVYPSAAASVRPCWKDHKDVVTELGLIWCEFIRIYAAEGPSLDEALVFHDRWLPGVLKRVQQITANCATGCVLARPAWNELIDRRSPWSS